MRIAIIGAGNMGGAIARGLAKGTVVQARDITVANPSQAKLDALKADFPDLHVTNDNREAAEGAELVILAVKPELVKSVLRELDLRGGRQILASLAAGLPFEMLAHYVTDREMTMFRIMPNIAISEMASMTLVASRNANARQEQLMLDLFNQMGLAMLVSEEDFDACTSMASCGIAYVLRFLQAMMQAGLEMGIPGDKGLQMVAQVAKGAAELLLNHRQHPALEIYKVCTPGGITIKGINELEHRGFTSAVIEAVKASNVPLRVEEE